MQQQLPPAINHLKGIHVLVVRWFDGSGSRIQAAMGLRVLYEVFAAAVGGLDSELREVMGVEKRGIRDQGWITVLSRRLMEPLQHHLKMVIHIPMKDPARSVGLYLTKALELLPQQIELDFQLSVGTLPRRSQTALSGGP